MLRLGIAGIGAIAGDYIGLIVGGKVRDVALTALCSRNEAHIREVAQRHGLQAAAFTDYGAMLRSGQVDAILICTPHAQHPEMTRQALEAGLHVLVEKPVGIFADEVAEILPVLAERPELVCGVMYNRRAAQAYRHVKIWSRAVNWGSWCAVAGLSPTSTERRHTIPPGPGAVLGREKGADC